MNAQGLNAPAIVAAVLCALLAAGTVFALPAPFGIAVGSALLLSGALLPMSLLMAKQWERAVVLRAGKLHSIRGPGLFMLIPFIDSVVAWMDQRIQTTQFNAEQALTNDSVPANIDAVLL